MKSISTVNVYHDETTIKSKNLQGHILLFIPQHIKFIPAENTNSLFQNQPIEYSPLDIFYNQIQELRNHNDSHMKFHFSELSGKKWHKQDDAHFYLVYYLLDACKIKNPLFFKQPLYFKFAIIYYPANLDKSLYSGSGKEKEAKFSETLLRMLLKGSVHYLYSPLNEVIINRIITDGQPRYREFDEYRIIEKLNPSNPDYSGLKKFCKVPSEIDIEHLPSKHKDYKIDTNEYIDCNYLQCADMILGCSNHVHFSGCFESQKPNQGDTVDSKKNIIAYQVKEVFDKRIRGASFNRSSHYNSFTISMADIKNSKWTFEKIKPINIIDSDSEKLFQ